MRAELRGTLARRGRVPKDGFGVAGRLRVMGEPGQIRRSHGRRRQGSEGEPVESKPTVRRERLLDRQASELVPKPDAFGPGHEHS
jgi:hypothetical protein